MGKKKTRARKPYKKVIPESRARLNIILDKDLKDWAHEYARRQHTTVTSLITDHFVELREREGGIGVEQI